MSDLHQIIADTLQSLAMTTTSFYQNKLGEGYVNLEKTLILLDGVISIISSLKVQGQEINIDETRLVASCTEAMNALEMKDILLLSDILEYEIKDLLETSLATIE